MAAAATAIASGHVDPVEQAKQIVAGCVEWRDEFVYADALIAADQARQAKRVAAIQRPAAPKQG